MASTSRQSEIEITKASEGTAPSASSSRHPELEITKAFEGIAPSASTSSRSRDRKLSYDVFINHRGPDVKRTLAATLYKTLTGMGLRIFLDREELELDDFLTAEIEDAMRSVSLHIAVVSQNYAQSPWCLVELSFMLKTGIPIIPIFYHVEPADVRYATGIYAEAFSRYTGKGRYTLEKIKEWKDALNNVSYNVGGIIHNEDDKGSLLKKIVGCVLKVIKNVPFVVANHPIGLDETLTDFERQKKLLEDLGLPGVSIENIEEGKEILASLLKSVRVLIILDDVDDPDQLDALVPNKDSLDRGSLIVVTTRELEVLRRWGISFIYKMKALDPSHAKQLFCWHTFLQPSPFQEFEVLVESFLNVCNGLPLSLKVFRAQLYGISSKEYWKTLLHKISRVLDKDIKDKLKISYDALDDKEKQIFLDTACFFIGVNKTLAIAVWDGSGWSGLHSWEKLLNKCLIEPDDDVVYR
ncbi:TMV resistance protein N-like [Cryptomeria japonica]|uniref:TMV resistance protein N-like n=1 Tax=Cryptomeria japonica TaxID=3369 RepID=UPI0027DA1AED|nr:TMV resistance protein N-like [Cryptomeria japonica]